MAELVIFLTLFGVRQNIVGFRCLLEFLLGFFVAGIFVRVIFYGQFAISFLELIGTGGFAHTEHFVVIAFVLHIAQ